MLRVGLIGLYLGGGKINKKLVKTILYTLKKKLK
jgi:hypothetical protein